MHCTPHQKLLANRFLTNRPRALRTCLGIGVLRFVALRTRSQRSGNEGSAVPTNPTWLTPARSIRLCCWIRQGSQIDRGMFPSRLWLAPDIHRNRIAHSAQNCPLSRLSHFMVEFFLRQAAVA